jgi:hypothetical protein
MAKSTITDFPVSEHDKFMLRLPPGMRDRIKAVADRNGRSMNAEIVSTLEETYPLPWMRDLLSDLQLLAFQWSSGDWRPLDEDSWAQFRMGTAPAHITDRMDNGTNHFVVAVIDKEDGLVNLISNTFKLVNGRPESVAEDYLTDEERSEYGRIYIQQATTKEDERRLRQLQKKMEPAFKLPADAARNLREKIIGLAPADTIDRLIKKIS